MRNLTHTAQLPGGYTATFRWSPSGDKHWTTEWEPSVPSSKSRDLDRVFLDAYATERRRFLSAVATAIGGGVMVIDTDGVLELIAPVRKPQAAPPSRHPSRQ
jgi:hypothetical protein